MRTEKRHAEHCETSMIAAERHAERNAAKLREVEVCEQCRALLIWGENG
jgi:hypothetical protein